MRSRCAKPAKHYQEVHSPGCTLRAVSDSTYLHSYICMCRSGCTYYLQIQILARTRSWLARPQLCTSRCDGSSTRQPFFRLRRNSPCLSAYRVTQREAFDDRVVHKSRDLARAGLESVDDSGSLAASACNQTPGCWLRFTMRIRLPFAGKLSVLAPACPRIKHVSTATVLMVPAATRRLPAATPARWLCRSHDAPTRPLCRR